MIALQGSKKSCRIARSSDTVAFGSDFTTVPSSTRVDALMGAIAAYDGRATVPTIQAARVTKSVRLIKAGILDTENTSFRNEDRLGDSLDCDDIISLLSVIVNGF